MKKLLIITSSLLILTSCNTATKLSSSISTKSSVASSSTNITTSSDTEEPFNYYLATEIVEGVENTKWGADSELSAVDGQVGKVVVYNSDNSELNATMIAEGFEATLTTAGSDWFSNQIFYHHEDIELSTQYEVGLIVNASEDSSITVNGEVINLVATVPYIFNKVTISNEDFDSEWTTRPEDAPWRKAILSIQFGVQEGNRLATLTTYTITHIVIHKVII